MARFQSGLIFFSGARRSVREALAGIGRFVRVFLQCEKLECLRARQVPTNREYQPDHEETSSG